MQTIVWEVECLSCVKVRRHCKKCGGKREFSSTGLFRVNANKKKLDIWLVYRCVRCGTSWNLPIYERINSAALPPHELRGFTQNDTALARHYAMDAALLARNGCEASPPALAISGPGLPAGETVRLVIKSEVVLDVRVAKLLRQKLCLSAKELDALLENCSIEPGGGRDLRRQRLGKGHH